MEGSALDTIGDRATGRCGNRQRAVTGVILDSGGVMIRPIGGEWFPTVSLEQILAERDIAWERDKLAGAVAAGDAYLDAVHGVPLRDETEERVVMARYHEIVLAGVGVTRDGAALAREIQAREEARDVVEPYKWTLEVLAELQARSIPVVVLSNAWPSLRRLHRGLGLDRFVKAMVISAEEGISKPDVRIFRTALAALGEPPDQTVFVDDWPDHIEAANGLGMRGIWLRHGTHATTAGLETISDLRALLDIIG
jgi:HAD superfamily hydrolase (TIGR01509 family)